MLRFPVLYLNFKGIIAADMRQQSNVKPESFWVLSWLESAEDDSLHVAPKAAEGLKLAKKR